MDIAAMSSMLSQSNLQQQVGVSVMKMAMGIASTNGNSLVSMLSEATKSMELSVQPNLGAKIDIQA
ncbi:YjfB family protein [Desulfosporosinus sp. FKA]|uniref:YjfB family protein n=1 Tax=Desulfosporosinus sp. FKA TaxID=1969834 RepID=UPI000B49ED8A|nr:YjfB family protein [Desulfosporosinus sp. FKA]